MEPIRRTNIESKIKPEAKPINNSITRAEPEQRPLMPSIMLKAFIMPTTQKIVIGIPKLPRYISPKPNRLPKLSKYTPVVLIMKYEQTA